MQFPHLARLGALLIAALLSGQRAVAQVTLDVAGLPDDAPFSVSATATDRVLTIDLDVEPGWHLYARDVGGGQPISVTVSGDFVAAGELIAPEDPRGYVVGLATLTLPIELDTEASGGPYELSATVELQVCDELECLPPMEATLSGDVRPIRTLLVVAQRDEHAARIEAWLGERGFAATVTTYADVTPADCEANDVILTDSKTFRAVGVGLRVVQAFPKTKTPIIAVGFLGTELVQEHGVAMTSGYI